MRITKRRLRQIIKEELEAVLKEEQEQLEEGAISSLVMGAMVALMGQNLDGPVDAPDGTNLDKQTVQAVLQAVEAAPNGDKAILFLTQQAENGLLPKSDFKSGGNLHDDVPNINLGYGGFNDTVNDTVKDIQSQSKKSSAGGGGDVSRVNFDMHITKLQGMKDANPEQAKIEAQKLTQMDGFGATSKATQDAIKKIAAGK